MWSGELLPLIVMQAEMFVGLVPHTQRQEMRSSQFADGKALQHTFDIWGKFHEPSSCCETMIRSSS